MDEICAHFPSVLSVGGSGAGVEEAPPASEHTPAVTVGCMGTAARQAGAALEYLRHTGFRPTGCHGGVGGQVLLEVA